MEAQGSFPLASLSLDELFQLEDFYEELANGIINKSREREASGMKTERALHISALRRQYEIQCEIRKRIGTKHGYDDVAVGEI